MSDDLIRSRGKALEESFFAQHNERLLRKLREKANVEAKKQALSAASGITDDDVLQSLVDLDVDVEGVAALALVPLVEVAWADGKLAAKEAEAILAAAEARGLARDSVPFQLLQGWLEAPPGERLLPLWKEFTSAFVRTLNPEDRAALKHDIVERARAVAEAAGGFLGFSKVSKAEQKMLDELEKAFE